MKKKILTIVLLATMVFSLIGCTKEPEVEGKLDLKTLKEEVIVADKSLPEMKCVSSFDEDGEDYFAYLCDVGYDKIQDYFYAYASEGTAEEVAVVFVRKTEDVPNVEKAIEEHVKSRIKTFENYAPDQVSVMEKALVFQRDNYVIFISSPEPSYMKATIEKALDSE